MATVTTGLAFNNQMSRVVLGIMDSLNLTLSAMDDLQDSMGKSFEPRTINAARSAIQQTEEAIKKVNNEIEQTKDKQEKFNNEIKNGQNAVDGLALKFGKVALALAPIFAVGKAIKGGLGQLTGIDSATAKLQALGHDGQSVEAIMGNALAIRVRHGLWYG